jgi:hypothetical protein
MRYVECREKDADERKKKPTKMNDHVIPICVFLYMYVCMFRTQRKLYNISSPKRKVKQTASRFAMHEG